MDYQVAIPGPLRGKSHGHRPVAADDFLHHVFSYHHGYFDGIEREFRGFGRVDQVDVESYGEFAQGNTASPYITDDKTLYQPPVKTITWFHTGAFVDRNRILSSFADEYFPRWYEERRPGETDVLGAFQENSLPEPDLGAASLTAHEWREALRACKGMTLRQEVYELDVDALERGEHRRVKLFSAAMHNCHIERLQAASRQSPGGLSGDRKRGHHLPL